MNIGTVLKNFIGPINSSIKIIAIQFQSTVFILKITLHEYSLQFPLLNDKIEEQIPGILFEKLSESKVPSEARPKSQPKKGVEKPPIQVITPKILLAEPLKKKTPFELCRLYRTHDQLKGC